ncbi:hypothetical protein D9M69_491880 [compost metagenome]
MAVGVGHVADHVVDVVAELQRLLARLLHQAADVLQHRPVDVQLAVELLVQQAVVAQEIADVGQQDLFAVAAVQDAVDEAAVAVQLGLGEGVLPVDFGWVNLVDRVGQHRLLQAEGVGGWGARFFRGADVAFVELLVDAAVQFADRLLGRGGFVGAADVLAVDINDFAYGLAADDLGVADHQLGAGSVGYGLNDPLADLAAVVLVQRDFLQDFHVILLLTVFHNYRNAEICKYGLAIIEKGQGLSPVRQFEEPGEVARDLRGVEPDAGPYALPLRQLVR